MTVADLTRKYGVSEQSIYRWQAKYGGMEVSEAKRLRQLEEENARLKRMVADLSLDKQMLEDVLSKSGRTCSQKSLCRPSDRDPRGQSTTGLPAVAATPLCGPISEHSQER